MVKCSMKRTLYALGGSGKEKSVGYYLYPRSSTGTKTPLRLSNSVGIIDSGYRGNLCGVFDNNCDSISGVDKYQRLLQICSPTLEPLFVKVIDDLSFFENTDRGDGGFGSTGR